MKTKSKNKIIKKYAAGTPAASTPWTFSNDPSKGITQAGFSSAAGIASGAGSLISSTTDDATSMESYAGNILSNAGSMAATGAALGPWGAAGGALVGAGVGVYQSIKASDAQKAMESQKSVNKNIAENNFSNNAIKDMYNLRNDKNYQVSGFKNGTPSYNNTGIQSKKNSMISNGEALRDPNTGRVDVIPGRFSSSNPDTVPAALEEGTSVYSADKKNIIPGGKSTPADVVARMKKVQDRMDNLETGKLKLTKLDKRTIDINKSNIQKQTELLNMNTKMFNMNNNTKVGKYKEGIDNVPGIKTDIQTKSDSVYNAMNEFEMQSGWQNAYSGNQKPVFVPIQQQPVVTQQPVVAQPQKSTVFPKMEPTRLVMPERNPYAKTTMDKSITVYGGDSPITSVNTQYPNEVYYRESGTIGDRSMSVGNTASGVGLSNQIKYGAKSILPTMDAEGNAIEYKDPYTGEPISSDRMLSFSGRSKINAKGESMIGNASSDFQKQWDLMMQDRKSKGLPVYDFDKSQLKNSALAEQLLPMNKKKTGDVYNPGDEFDWAFKYVIDPNSDNKNGTPPTEPPVIKKEEVKNPPVVTNKEKITPPEVPGLNPSPFKKDVFGGVAADIASLLPTAYNLANSTPEVERPAFDRFSFCVYFRSSRKRQYSIARYWFSGIRVFVLYSIPFCIHCRKY